jgi:hypothetical protein
MSTHWNGTDAAMSPPAIIATVIDFITTPSRHGLDLKFG